MPLSNSLKVLFVMLLRLDPRKHWSRQRQSRFRDPRVDAERPRVTRATKHLLPLHKPS